MAKSAKERKEDNVVNLSNSEGLHDKLIVCAERMVEIDAQRKKLNGEAGDVRATLKELGVDTDAFRDVYGYFKKRRHQREGYDESKENCFDALNKAATGDLFSPKGE